MRREEIDKQLRRRPFVPFVLRMSNGKSYEVREPGMLKLTRDSLTLAVHGRGGPRSLDIIHWDLDEIVRLEPVTRGSAGRRPSHKR